MSNKQAKDNNKRPKSGNVSIRPPVTMWQALRDVMIKAIDKGIWLPFFVCLIFGYLIYRLPDNRVGEIVEKIVDGFASGALLGWLLLIVAIILWSQHVKLIRRLYSKDMERVGKEKTELQQEIFGQTLGTSNRKRVSLSEEER